MTIRDIINNRNEILTGHMNELKYKIGVGSETDEVVFKHRETICNSCPLKNGNSCDTQKWINASNFDVSNMPKEGYIRGCGCRLSAKQKSKGSKCPAGFWGGEFDNL